MLIRVNTSYNAHTLLHSRIIVYRLRVHSCLFSFRVKLMCGYIGYTLPGLINFANHRASDKFRSFSLISAPFAPIRWRTRINECSPLQSAFIISRYICSIFFGGQQIHDRFKFRTLRFNVAFNTSAYRLSCIVNNNAYFN